MTLLDAPRYDAARDRRTHYLAIGAGVLVLLLVLVGVGGFFAGHGWFFSNVPSEHRVSKFLTAVQDKDFKTAYAMWNNDPNWQQHPDQYKDYNFGKFQLDWGPSSDYGVITSHKMACSKRAGSGVIVGAYLNGRPSPMFLFVEGGKHTIGFSPLELEC